MICISITPESRQLAKVDLYNAANQCDIVEVSLDRLLKEPDVKAMLEGFEKPILVSCRNKNEGGHFEGTEDQRMALLRQAILAGPAYIEMDPVTAQKIPRFGKTQRVISFVSLARPFLNIEEAFDEATRCHADVVKFTWPTETLEAAWPLLASVSRKRLIPVVGLGLGRSGLTFSLLSRKYGSPWVYAALEKGMEAFPGQPTVGELDDVYRWRGVDSKTRFIGITSADPSEKIVSKILNTVFDKLGLNMRCLPLDFQSLQQVSKMFDVLKIPAIIATPSMYRRIRELASNDGDSLTALGMADLVIKQSHGWEAYNLIWKASLRALEEKIGHQTPGDRPLNRKNTLIIGADDMAISIASGIKQRSGSVSLTSGDDTESQKIAQAAEIRFVPQASMYDTLSDVIVITSPNLNHGSRITPINPSIFRKGMTVMDLSNLPFESPLIEEARLRGCKVIEPTDVFTTYISTMCKSLTGQQISNEAIAEALSKSL